MRAEILGMGHPQTLRMKMYHAASLLHAETTEGDGSAAEREFKELIQLQRKYLGNDHEDTSLSVQELTWLYFRHEKFEEAEELIGVENARKERMDWEEASEVGCDSDEEAER